MGCNLIFKKSEIDYEIANFFLQLEFQGWILTLIKLTTLLNRAAQFKTFPFLILPVYL